MTQIVPAILSLDEEDYRAKLKRIEECGIFEDGWIQVDFMDGQFVQDRSVGVEILEKYPTGMKVEAHLMVEKPLDWLDGLKTGGADRVIFHLEAGNSDDLIAQGKLSGFQVGLAVKPETDLQQLGPFLDKVESVLLMAVHPGSGGQQFIAETIDKVREIARLRSKDSLSFLIGVDGGINDKVAKELVLAGADYLVIGSHLFHGDINENFKKIQEAISK